MDFVKWCMINGYGNVLNCFIGDFDEVDDLAENEQIISSQTDDFYDLIDTSKLKKWNNRKGNNNIIIKEKDKNGSILSYWFKCEKCNDIHKLTIKEAKSRIQNSNNHMFLCKRCQLFSNSKNQATLGNWLNNHKEIELVGKINGELNNIVKIDPNHISINSNIKVMVKHNERTYILEVKGLTKGNTINFFQSITFKDWCLIFYRYPFVSYLRYIENKEVKSRKDKNIHNVEVKCRYERYYTGKQVIEHYDYKNNSKAKSTKMGEGKADDKYFKINYSFYELSYSSTAEPGFVCDNYCKNGCKSNMFRSQIKNITNGIMWCDSDTNIDNCVKCGNEAEKIKKDSLLNKIDLNTFLRENCTKEEIEKILKEYDKKIKLYKYVNITSDSIEKLANEIIFSSTSAFKVIKGAYERNEKRLNPKRLEGLEETNIEEIRNEFIREIKEFLSTNEVLNRMRTLSLEGNIYIIIAKSENTSEYDFLIKLDKITIKALDEGILYGKPIVLKDGILGTEWEKLENVNKKIYPVTDDTTLEALLKGNITSLSFNNWNNLFNGLAGPFENIRFTTLELSDRIEKIKPGCFKDCEANKTYFPKHIRGQLKYKYTESKNDNGICKIEGTCNNNVASRRQPQMQGTNFIQYNDVLKMGEALRVYENRLTLYREGEGQGFKEYEYMNNFEYQKFYGDDPDDLILSLLLALNEKVIVSEVTDALIDIYNEMNK